MTEKPDASVFVTSGRWGMNRERFALTAIVLLGMGFLWMAAIVFASGCATIDEIPIEIPIEVAVNSSSSSTATGNNSNVINLQLAGGGGGLLAGLLLGAWLGRRTPVKAVKRLVGFIDKAVLPEHREGVRHEQSCYMHRPLRKPTKYSSVCTCDPAERLINRIVKRSKA